MSLEQTYYTTSNPMTMSNFIALEVEERNNCDIEDVNYWIEKYGIAPQTQIIWVALHPHVAARYQMNAEDWCNAENVYNANPEQFDVKQIKGTDGFLIPETDDGDDGFIFVLTQNGRV